jgi:thymidine kinase
MIKLLTGPMFSFKTTRLFHEMEKASLQNKKICYVTPKRDDRCVISHNSSLDEMYSNFIKSSAHKISINSFSDLNDDEMLSLKGSDYIFIDEYFMIKDAYMFATNFYDKNVYFAGLMITSENTVFPEAIKLLPYVEYIDKENAICMKCGKPANFSFYNGDDKKSTVKVDSQNNKYSCLCYKCYEEAMKNRK